MGLFSHKIAPAAPKTAAQPATAPKPAMPSEPLFLLKPGEKIDLSGHNIQYRGPAIIVSTSGFGGTSGGLFGGAAHGKQQKRENSVWDAKLCYAYLTNERMVFVHQPGKKNEVVGDVPLAAITAISPNKVFLGPTIQVSVPSATGVDNIGIIFNSGQGDDHADSHRIRERDQWLAHIKVLREAAVNAAQASQIPPSAPVGDPMQVLKMRLANGEITTAQYEEMKKLIAS